MLHRRVQAENLATATVSAVVPCFNHGALVHQAVASLRAQSRPLHQIVVVNDGSTDGETIEALTELASTGVTVVHQSNQGIGAARNAGVTASSGDAVLFVDSDDRCGDAHVDAALAALAGAPADVGFVYPDLQCVGAATELVVMPPYNLSLLLERNFCAMGGIVDRAVFEAGFEFRADLRQGSEDWEFFVHLGTRGVFGQVFHDSPLLYRRWGFSHSDGVTQRGQFARRLRALHPELDDSARRAAIKAEWSPALSVVPAPGVDLGEVAQTCDDYEVVPWAGPAGPPVRGRWVLALGPAGSGALRDAGLVERVVRRGMAGAARPLSVVRQGRAIGLLMDGRAWAQRPVEDPAANDPERGWTEGAGAGAGWDCGGAAEIPMWPAGRWPEPPRVRVPRPPPEGGTGGRGDPVGERARRGIEIERAYRHLEAEPLLVPAGGYTRLPQPPGGIGTGFEALTRRAWSNWGPSRAVRVDLVLDAAGRPALDAVPAAGPVELPDRRSLGWAWAQDFPGTMGIFTRFDLMTHSTTYRQGQSPAADEAVVGYLATEAAPGRIAFEVAWTQAAPGHQPPPVAGAKAGLWLERGPLARWPLPAPRQWPLYEVLGAAGRRRYSCHPDATMAGPLHVGSRVVAAIGAPEPADHDGSLFETEQVDPAATRYLSDPDAPGRLLGSISRRDGRTVPLLRVHDRRLECRLTLDAPGPEDDVVVEGVLGYAAPPDPGRAPLLRWWDPSAHEWRLSLGEDLRLEHPGLIFQGALGVARVPGDGDGRLVDLWEVTLGRHRRFVTELDPQAAPHRVVARIWGRSGDERVPLVAMSDGGNRSMPTTCSAEGRRAGLPRREVLGWIEASAPAPEGDAAGTDVPGWAIAGPPDPAHDPLSLVWGTSDPGGDELRRVVLGEQPGAGSRSFGWGREQLTPFGHPLYLVDRTPGAGSEVSMSLPTPGTGQVRDVACFLVSTGGGVPGDGSGQPPGPGYAVGARWARWARLIGLKGPTR